MKNCKVIFSALISAVMLLCLSPSLGFADPLDSWKWINPIPQGNHLRAVAFNDGTYVAVGDAGTVITASKSDWEVGSIVTTKSLQAIAYGKGLFVAVGEQGTLLTSPDGIAWTSRSSSTERSLASIVFGNDRFVAVGKGGTIITSEDGESWTSQVSGTVDDLLAVTYGNGRFVAVERFYSCYFGAGCPQMGGAPLTSPDGITWTEHPVAFGMTIVGIAFGNNSFVAVGEGEYQSPPSDAVYVSRDGISWAKSAMKSFKAIVFVNGQFMAVGRNASATSPDGVAWSVIPGAQSFLSVTHGEDIFVAVGEYGTIGMKHDTHPAWSVSPPTLVDRSLITFHRGSSSVQIARPVTSCLMGPGGLCATTPGFIGGSPDGKRYCYKDTGTSLYLWDIAYGNGLFVLVGSGGTILTSPDACEWTSRQSGVSEYIPDITFDNGRFVAAASDSIITSNDGITWAVTAIEGNKSVTRVGYGNGLYVATGPGGTILTSTDGFAWDERASGTTAHLSEIAFGNGLVVTVGSNGTALSSTDGITWNSVQLAGSFPLTSVAFGGGYFVAVGQKDYDTGNVVFSSQDGVTWTERFVGTFFRLDNVTYTGNAFVVAGERGISLRSDPFCGAYLSSSFSLTIPLVSFGGAFFSAVLQYEPGQSPDGLFKVTNAETLPPARVVDACGPAVLSPEGDGYRLQIPEVTYNGAPYVADFLYVPDSTGGIHFRLISATRK